MLHRYADVPLRRYTLAIDRLGQAFGPVVGGAALHYLGAGGIMRFTGYGLAIISSVCLLFIGDGCLSWVRQSCMRSIGGGYAPLGQNTGEIDQADELEMAEAFDAKASPHVNGHANGLSNGHANGHANGHSNGELSPVAPVKATGR